MTSSLGFWNPVLKPRVFTITIFVSESQTWQEARVWVWSRSFLKHSFIFSKAVWSRMSVWGHNFSSKMLMDVKSESCFPRLLLDQSVFATPFGLWHFCTGFIFVICKLWQSFYTFYAFKCDIQYLLVSLLTFMCLYSKLDMEELSEKCHCDMDVVRRVSQTGKRDNIPISVHNCPKWQRKCDVGRTLEGGIQF